MAVVTRPPGERAVARPSWVRRQDSQHEGIVAGIMLALVIVGIVVFLFWGQMLRIVASSQLFHAPSAPTDRPAEGAAPPGPPVVVSLDQPVAPSSAPPTSVESAGAVTQAPGSVTPAQEVATPDQLTVLDPTAAGASIIADAPATTSPGADTPDEGAEAGAPPMSEADAAAEAAAHDAAETARAAEEARAAADARTGAVARAAPTPGPTAAPAATATRPALTPTPAAPAPTPRATASAASGVAAGGKRARVVRTGGRGVVMYSAPRQGARLPAGFPEGSVISVLSANGEWTQVQGNGQTGWVKSEFLAPAE